MQDWDFPHFTSTLDVNLPGFNKHIISFDAMELQISGKWFNYGIIFLVMIFDLNMWKNQIFYYPEKYGQYIGKKPALERDRYFRRLIRELDLGYARSTKFK